MVGATWTLPINLIIRFLAFVFEAHRSVFPNLFTVTESENFWYVTDHLNFQKNKKNFFLKYNIQIIEYNKYTKLIETKKYFL